MYVYIHCKVEKKDVHSLHERQKTSKPGIFFCPPPKLFCIILIGFEYIKVYSAFFLNKKDNFNPEIKIFFINKIKHMEPITFQLSQCRSHFAL